MNTQTQQEIINLINQVKFYIMSLHNAELSEKIMDLVEKSLESLHTTSIDNVLIEKYLRSAHLIEDESDKESSMREMIWSYKKTAQLSFYRIFIDYNISVEGFEEDPDHCSDTSYTRGLYKLHAKLIQEDEITLNKILERVKSVIICFELL